MKTVGTRPLFRRWIETIHTAAHLYIRKVGVPDSVLTRPGRLLAFEYGLNKSQSEAGYPMANTLPGLEEISLYILHHRERWDGKGYPTGLNGTNIPLGARIIAVADTLGAVTSLRPYRESRSVGEALSEIAGVSGNQLCPEVCEIFLAFSSELSPPLGSLRRDFAAVEGRKKGGSSKK